MPTADPFAQATFLPIPPSDVFRINYDLESWVNPWNPDEVNIPYDLHNEDVLWMFLHHGGGANTGGELVEEPELTWRQKVAVSFGICRTVLRSWEQYHVTGKNMMGLAYDIAVSQYGQIFRARCWRANGGQYGGTSNHWNRTSLAVVWVGGLGQSMTGAAWRAVSRIWLEGSYGLPAGRALTLKPHNYTNFDSPPQYQTSCPGEERTQQIADGRHLQALGTLKLRKVPMRGARVRSLTRGLMLLGYLGRVGSVYGRGVQSAVYQFQADHDLDMDGIVGPITWQALAEQASIL